MTPTRSTLRTALTKAKAELAAIKKAESLALAAKDPGPIDTNTEANRMMVAIRAYRFEIESTIRQLQAQRTALGTYKKKVRGI
jgi:hypothetical protein